MLKKKNRKMSRGMTLIEIIVVITILSLLMAAVGVAVIPMLDQAKTDRAYLDMANIQNALKTYYAKKGSYPDNGTGLKALVDAQIMEKAPTDPWNNPYQYLIEGGKPVIKSYGKDGTAGGADGDADLSSSDNRAEKK